MTHDPMTKAKVILDRFPYRYVECGKLEINGMPDFRILKYNEITGFIWIELSV